MAVQTKHVHSTSCLILLSAIWIRSRKRPVIIFHLFRSSTIRIKTVLIWKKTLNYLLTNSFASATIIGATGDRPDHTMANFSILMKYHQKISLQFFDERCTAQIVYKKIRFSSEIGQQISLMPMGKCSGITTQGLKFPLKNETLELGIREGSSNEAVQNIITITLKSGSLLLFTIHSHILK